MKFYDDGSCMHINIFSPSQHSFMEFILQYLLPSLTSPACYQTRLRTHLFIFIEGMLMQSIHTLLQSRL